MSQKGKNLPNNQKSVPAPRAEDLLKPSAMNFGQLLSFGTEFGNILQKSFGKMESHAVKHVQRKEAFVEACRTMEWIPPKKLTSLQSFCKEMFSISKKSIQESKEKLHVSLNSKIESVAKITEISEEDHSPFVQFWLSSYRIVENSAMRLMRRGKETLMRKINSPRVNAL